MECEGCQEYRYTVLRLQRIIEDLQKELSQERRKTDDYGAVKRERDEMRKTLNRSYDAYITNPERREGD